MYGQSPPFRHGGRGRGRGVSQPQQQQQIHLNSNFFANPNTFIQQNPNFLPHLNPFLQSPVGFHQLQQQFPNSNFPIQPNSEKNNVQTRHPNGNNNISYPQQQVNAQSEIVEIVDKAVVRARSDLLVSNENVSAWKVSQAALLMVKADSWESLGFQMQQVPSLNRLLATEGKINAFIHCFVAVRRITSVYDLEVAICESEGIEQFEELELGPLVRHPLVLHYFSVTSDVTEVYRIRTEEIIYYLCEFIDIRPKKEVKVDTFLDFISKKKSVSGREKLCVRIQNFGAYVRHIKQARQSEDRVLKKCYEKTTTKSVKMSEKRPLFSAQKKEMDDHFTAISQRMKSFSSANAQFCGTHIRFVSSSSEDDNGEGEEYENNRDKENADHHCSLSLPNVRPECASKCPYPSATEEMTRLGLKNAVDTSPCTLGGGVRCSADNEPCRRKRRFQHACSSSSVPCKQIKRGKSDANLKNNGPENEVISVPSFSAGSLRMFVTTWKVACQGNSADEVLERMLQFYKTKKKRKVKEMFTTYPFVGLLYSAVTCIKFGMCDNMYDACQTLSQPGMGDKPLENSVDYTSVDVEPAKEDLPVPAPKIPAHDYDVAAEDIMERISGYFEDDIMNYINPSGECRFHFLRKLCKCEYWLSELYSVNRFESLGYGEYFMFLEKYMHLLPRTLRKFIIGDTSENVTLEARLLPMQLDVLLSQTFDSLYGDEIINMPNISELLARQFPLVCFKLVNNDVMANLVDTIREKVHKLTSTSVLFSAPLSKLPSQNGKKLVESSGVGNDTVTREGIFTTEDAIEVLTKAPMLTDLSLWLHWDILFAPSLGSIVEWLLKEVNTKEFLCLITKDGKVIRVDHSATPDSFLKVFIRGSPFETAVALLSLCVLYGSERNVPLSLIKSHTRQGFEVIISNYLELGLLEDKDSHAHGKPSYDQCVVGKSISSNLGIKLASNKHILNKAASVTSRFILDCLSYLPIEFCSFAADVLISGLQHFLKDVPSAILNECKQIEQRLMLHEVGISLGLVEWVQDYHSFHSSATAEFSSGSSCLEVINSKFNTRSNIGQELVKYPSSLGELLVSYEVVHNDLKGKQVNSEAAYTEISVDGQAAASEKSKVVVHIDDDPAKVIESIRHEEFGLDQSLSVTENKMLEKQHARLGRALHCLSQELYSQDSHFLLELVQNADDNIYPRHVEPTLTFVLHEKGIIVLNNEQGFSANDIRALCDIGNSTKRGHNAGYIGKKGIGFKSVFRVSDAPEIHSNGFHIKFDITKGQIGFVLPTVVPPCDIELYSRWATADADRMDPNFWSTCIVLPFRSNLLEGFGMNNILSMFSDLHPSVLLFLHRLQCIKVRNILDDSLIVMRKEIIGDGIVKVALGNEKMTWFVATQKLKADVISSNVQTTEISIAFTLQETAGGGYVPILNQQPVFAFLPLRTYGLKFILQGDFVLPSSREEVDGNSPWNQWLLSEFPDLFVNAERSFCGLPCYRGSLGKAITVFMSFIPLVGEVHGFFSSLPRMIISKLRMSNCLILESDEEEWVPPCKVLRNWTDQTCALLPSGLLHEHLGLGFLNKDVVLPDSLAKALGIEDYGPRILLRVISSLCRSNNGLKSMGLSWLASWLSAIYVASSHSFLQTSQGLGTELDFILNLQKTPFIPLSDGKYSSLDEGTIWMHSEVVGQCITDECVLKAFPKLYVKLRIVSPNLLAAATDTTVRESVTTMLYKVGVQQLSFHDVVKVHVLPSLSDDKSAAEQEELMIEYLAFAMFHLQSSCTSCGLDRGGIIAELREKALILTNYGYKRPNEVPIHFNLEYGSLDVNKLISGLDIKWHEIDTAYLKHPITKSISGGALKWRNFFQELGVTDFVQVVQVEKSVCDMSLVNSKEVIHCKDVTSMDPVSKNWESEELSHLLSCLCSRNDGLKSKCLLEILDRLWDDCFTNKVNGYLIDCNGESKLFKSSFISILQDFPWVLSNIDNKLHYPKDLFHDCVEVKSVFGVSAPYTVPKVRSEKLLTDIGLKTQVTLDDALCILRLWRRSEAPFKASISQMSNFYAFLWKGMAHSKKKVTEELLLGPYIFIPNISSYMDDDVVPGVFLSPQEVYWHDTIGSVDQMKSSCSECNTSSPCRKMLYNYYPNLHDFFVNECGVDKSPPFCSYLQILLQLSTIALPHQVAKRVFEVFLMWDNGLKSGSLSFEDAEFLKESLMKKELTVLPTRQDKWVSLHALFGLICWCDDDNLRREFRHLDGVDFLYFGESNDGEDQMLQAKVSTIMQRLGIPALSEIVTREAIYYGPADCSFMLSLVNRVLPYAQRYVYYTHADKYFLLKQSGFQNLRNLKIVVVEKLFFRNVIKKCKITSKKRHECNCLLQDNILYCSQESDPHSIFLELSCLLYNGTPDLHFANFLHMITTMAESGATEEQTEFFILNSQKVPQLPAEETFWSLQSVSSSVENNASLLENGLSAKAEEQNTLFKRRPSINSNWPPVDWKTAPGFNCVSTFGLKKPGESSVHVKKENFAELSLDQIDTCPSEISNDANIEIDPSVSSQGVALLEAEISESLSNVNVSSNLVSKVNLVLDSVDLVAHDNKITCTSNCSERDQASAQQALLTGRLGELIAFKYFVGELGEASVKWVNQTNETGLPYDIILGGDENAREYIEVKATKSARKNWFLISMREWQFAVEKGESFSIAHVVLADNNMAKVTIYKNLARLCQLGNLRLAVVVPK